MSETGQGGGPKTGAAIRAKLDAMRKSYQSDVPRGDRMEGVQPADRIQIASFHDAKLCAEFQHSLSVKGIMSSSELRNRKTHVSVDYEDRGLAVEILAAYIGRDRQPKGLRRDFEFLLLGMILGTTAALVVVVGARNPAVLLPYAASWALIGGLLGHFVDRLRSIWREHHRIRLGVREYLLLTAICAVAVWMPYYASAVLQN